MYCTIQVDVTGATVEGSYAIGRPMLTFRQTGQADVVIVLDAKTRLALQREADWLVRASAHRPVEEKESKP